MIILVLLLVEHDEAQVQALEDELTKAFGPYAFMDMLWHCQVELTLWHNLSQDTAIHLILPNRLLQIIRVFESRSDVLFRPIFPMHLLLALSFPTRGCGGVS